MNVMGHDLNRTFFIEDSDSDWYVYKALCFLTSIFRDEDFEYKPEPIPKALEKYDAAKDILLPSSNLLHKKLDFVAM